MKKRIKVLNVLLDDRIGGSHSRIFTINRGLREKGIDYYLVIPEGGGDWGLE